MERLPKELFLVVFSFLSFEQKLECLLVSKDWYHWILQYSLFNELECESPASLNKIISYFQQNSILGQSVFKLHIKNCCNLNYNLTTLPNLFPNVKEFQLDEARDTLDHTTKQEEEEESIYWRNIQKLNSTECFEDGLFLIGNILKSPCSYLTTIEILFDIDYHQSFNSIHRIPYIKKKAELLDNIKNAPYLQSLTLDRLHLSMNDLEQLHQFTPNLKSLSLKNITLLHSNQQEEANVISVPLEMLHIQFTFINHDILLAWLSYITQKYTHLESFRFECKDNVTADQDWPTMSYQEEILSLISSNPRLKHYHIWVCPFSTPIVNELDKNKTSLESISIYVDSQNTMDNQCKALSSSNQKNLLNSITIHSHSNNNALTPKPLDLFHHLTHLELSSISQPLPIHLLPTFLKDLQHLNSISLNGSHISCGATLLEDTNPFTSAIKHIDIGKLKIDTFQDLKSINYFFKFLFKKTPHLQSFSLCFKFPTLEEPLEEEMFLEFEKDNPHIFDYLDLHLILDLEHLQHLKAVQLRSDSHWYQFIRSKKASTIPAYYYLYDTRVGEFRKKYNILPRYFFTTLFLNNKQLFVNSIKV